MDKIDAGARTAPTPVTAIVLAAGLSRRMGDANKLLLPLGGQPMVRHVVLRVLASRCQTVLVVLGHQADQVRQALSGLSVQFVLNPSFDEGLGSSVRAGACEVAPDNAALVCLGDMPSVDTAVINSLIDAYRPDSGVVACQPVFGGKRGNPVLWGAACVKDLTQLQGDQGARALLLQYGDAVALVDVSQSGVLVDVDTPQDYLQFSRADQ